MTCTTFLLPLLVAEAVFFTEIYTQGKKVELIIQNLHLSQYSNENKCGLACQYKYALSAGSMTFGYYLCLFGSCQNWFFIYAGWNRQLLNR